MNLYVVVEGEGETKVYPQWISVLNPQLAPVTAVNAITNNSYFLVSGRGNPQIYDIVENAIEDIKNHPAYTRLVVVLDSEDRDVASTYNEAESIILSAGCPSQYRIVVQHFCLETWALAYKKMVKGIPSDPVLRRYQEVFNVANNDPELLPSLPDDGLSRVQFAFKYLRRLLREKNPQLVYTKRNPIEIAKPYFFSGIVKRHTDDAHIQSLRALLTAFV